MSCPTSFLRLLLFGGDAHRALPDQVLRFVAVRDLRLFFVGHLRRRRFAGGFRVRVFCLLEEVVVQLAVEVEANHVDRLLAVRRQRAGDGLVQRHPERVEVGAGVDAVLPQHLGCHVVQRAADLPVEDLMALHRHAEVHDLRLPRLADEDVRRLEIEMDDAEVVDVVEAGSDLQDHVVERVPVLPVEELRDLLPGEVLHREVREAVVQQVEVEDLDDAGVLEPRERGELRFEP